MPCFFRFNTLLRFALLLCFAAGPLAIHPSIHPGIQVKIHSAPVPALHVAGPMGPWVHPRCAPPAPLSGQVGGFALRGPDQ